MAQEFWTVTALALGSGGEQIANTFHYNWNNTGPTAIGGQSVCIAFETDVLPALLACVGSSYKYAKTRAKCISGANINIIGESDAVVDTVGSNSGTAGVVVNCVVIKRLSAFAGRNKRGRIFVSPVPAANFDVNGKLIGTLTPFRDMGVALQDSLTTFTGPEADVVMLPCVSPHLVDGIPLLVTSYALSPICGIRRSRRLRVPN